MRVFVLVLAVIFWSCDSNSTSEIGSDFFNGGSLDFSMIDSCTVSLSTIAFEKLNTSDADRILLGTHEDSKLGQIKASAYMQLSTSATGLPDNNVRFDYCAIFLRYDKYIYYDTTSSLTLKAYRVTEEIKREDDGYLYNNNTFAHESSPLGELTFKPRPNQDDSVEIRLPNDFGNDLFTKVQNDSEQLLTNQEFLKYLRGIAIIPDGATGCVLGFAKNPEIRVYYRDSNTVPATQQHLSFVANAIYSNNISADRSDTKLSTLPLPKARLKASETDDQSYLQAGTGLALRIDLPYLRELKQNENFFVVRAILEFYPVRKSYGKMMPLPKELLVYPVDKRNNFLSDAAGKVPLIEDLDLGLETYYTMDVTSFVKSQMAIEELNENALVFTIDKFNTSIDRLYIASHSHDYKTQLKVYYTTVNN